MRLKGFTPRQGESKEEKKVPGHLNLAMLVFGLIMIVSIILALHLNGLV